MKKLSSLFVGLKNLEYSSIRPSLGVKATTCKAKAKDLTFKAKAKDLTVKAKAKDLIFMAKAKDLIPEDKVGYQNKY